MAGWDSLRLGAAVLALGGGCSAAAQPPAAAPAPPSAAAAPPPKPAPIGQHTCPASERLARFELALKEQLAKMTDCARPANLAASSSVAFVALLTEGGSVQPRITSSERATTEEQRCIHEHLARLPSNASAQAEWLSTELVLAPGAAPTFWHESTQSAAAPAEPAAPAKKASAPVTPTQVSGRLPPEVIRRLVRSKFPLFRGCYEQALVADPTLSGSVTVRFVIGRDGVVSNATAHTSLADCMVAECVRHIFLQLRFPRPEGGLVTVSYPVMFEPG